MRVSVVVAGLALAAAAGCGPSLVSADGKVTMNGKAYNPETDGDLNLTLTPEGGGTGHSAKVGADGGFQIRAADGRGVPAGKYKVSYTRYPGKDELAKLKGPPAPKNKDTGEVWDVASGKSFTLDIKGK